MDLFRGSGGVSCIVSVLLGFGSSCCCFITHALGLSGLSSFLLGDLACFFNLDKKFKADKDSGITFFNAAPWVIFAFRRGKGSSALVESRSCTATPRFMALVFGSSMMAWAAAILLALLSSRAVISSTAACNSASAARTTFSAVCAAWRA